MQILIVHNKTVSDIYYGIIRDLQPKQIKELLKYIKSIEMYMNVYFIRK